MLAVNVSQGIVLTTNPSEVREGSAVDRSRIESVASSRLSPGLSSQSTGSSPRLDDDFVTTSSTSSGNSLVKRFTDSVRKVCKFKSRCLPFFRRKAENGVSRQTATHNIEISPHRFISRGEVTVAIGPNTLEKTHVAVQERVKTDYELAKELIHLSSKVLLDPKDLDRCLQKEIHEILTAIAGLNKGAASGASDTTQQIDARINSLIRKLNQNGYPIEKMGREIELVRERLADIAENKSAANYSPERELLMIRLLKKLEELPYSLERQVVDLEGMLKKGKLHEMRSFNQ